MILASLDNVNPATLKDVMLILLSLLGAAVMVKQFFHDRKREITPQPLQVAMSSEAASKAEFERYVATNKEEHEKIFSKIGGVERGASKLVEDNIERLRLERREDMRALHHEVNEVGKKVASLESATTLQNVALANLQKNQEQLPGEIIATLVNAKKLNT
jgi:uncharacterized protein YdcH (DUF465 family)